jgi:methionine-S-sulfoxide reductase
VVRTRVGYTGGTTKDPTYRSIGDHSESFQVDFDPAVTSYEKLLEVFWKTPNACAVSGSRQYRSAIFWHNAAQRKLAEATRDRESARRGQKVPTAVLPLATFYLAEDYHQKYYLRLNRALLREFQAIYPREKEFLNSTAVARVNGYLGGHGSAAALEKEIQGLGLSAAGRQLLLAQARRR